jgi:hypothetical protein
MGQIIQKQILQWFAMNNALNCRTHKARISKVVHPNGGWKPSIIPLVILSINGKLNSFLPKLHRPYNTHITVEDGEPFGSELSGLNKL